MLIKQVQTLVFINFIIIYLELFNTNLNKLIDNSDRAANNRRLLDLKLQRRRT